MGGWLNALLVQEGVAFLSAPVVTNGVFKPASVNGKALTAQSLPGQVSTVVDLSNGGTTVPSAAVVVRGNGLGTVLGSPTLFHVEQETDADWGFVISNKSAPANTGMAFYVQNNGNVSFAAGSNAGFAFPQAGG